MLKTIDILLGVSVVMLIVSMGVTVLTQFILGLLQSRGRNLREGLANLLQQIDPALQRDIATRISTAVLTHPMMAASGKFKRLGVTIHREEFTKLLMDLAAGNAPKEVLDKLGESAKQKISEVLGKNGIVNPAQVLDKVRARALQMEMNHPAQAAHERQAVALMQEANSHLVAKVNTWFDVTIDRVSERFTRSSHIITTICALVVAFAVQLDSLGLINRLSRDDALRQQLVVQAAHFADQAAPGDAPISAQHRAVINEWTDAGLVHIPSDFSQWKSRWAEVSLMGVLLTALLLSLGAPFWYNTLKNLIRLRSLVSKKDDDQREERQQTQRVDVATTGAAKGG